MWPLIKLLPAKTNFIYTPYAWLLGIISAIACAASLFFTIYPMTPPCGGLNCGVDFKGGTVIEFMSPTPIDLADVRAAMGDLPVGDVQPQSFDEFNALVRYEPPEEADPAQVASQVRETLNAALGGNLNFTRLEVVGPKVSGELFFLGVVALLCGICLMLVISGSALASPSGGGDHRADARRAAHVRLVRLHADGFHADGGGLDPHHYRLFHQR